MDILQEASSAWLGYDSPPSGMPYSLSPWDRSYSSNKDIDSDDVFMPDGSDYFSANDNLHLDTAVETIPVSPMQWSNNGKSDDMLNTGGGGEHSSFLRSLIGSSSSDSYENEHSGLGQPPVLIPVPQSHHHHHHQHHQSDVCFSPHFESDSMTPTTNYDDLDIDSDDLLQFEDDFALCTLQQNYAGEYYYVQDEDKTKGNF